MPDAQGHFRSAFYGLTAARHAEIFGPDEESELDTEEPEFEITWTPEWDLDGATFIPE